MDYAQTIEYLYNCTPVFEKVGAGAYKAGLDTTHAFDKHFGHPHKQYRTIHIGGTNGKGSVSHSVASILQADGYRVGLYTSPHLIDFGERIRVNGKSIDKQYVVDFVERERAFFEPLHPSFFELTTALALKYFADERVDIAVIEVGLGGRLDCTNIISPVLSVITNISYDHTDLLGDTLEQIAAEKAGIIKPGIPVIVGERQAQTAPVFERAAKAAGSPLRYASDDCGMLSARLCQDGGINYDTVRYGTFRGDLGGLCQPRNTQTILSIANELSRQGILRDAGSVGRGLGAVAASTGLMGRWQVVGEHPLVICDTGHNVGGWSYTVPQLSTLECATLRMVFGMVSDKDISTVMSMLPKDATYYFTQASTKRAISADEVCAIGHAHGLRGHSYTNVAQAYEHALQDSVAGDVIFIGGSSYVVADYLTNKCPGL